MRANRVMVQAAAIVTGVLTVSACTGGGDGAEVSPRRQEVLPRVQLASALRPFDDCDALSAYVHGQAAALAGPYGLVGDGGPKVFAVEDRAMAVGAPLAASAPAAGAAGGATRDAASPVYSGTNVQEAGVDEPDVVKTDGRILVSVVNGRLHVVDVSGDGAPAQLGSMDLPPAWGETQLLLAGDRLLVLSPAGSQLMPVDARRVAGLRGPEVATTQVHVVDLSTPSSPRIVSTVDLQGQLVAARMVDGVARVVVRSQPMLRGFTVPADDSAESKTAAARNNRAVIESSTVDDWVPSFAVVDASGRTVEGGRLASCGDVFQPGEPAVAATVSVTSIDPSDPVPRGTASVVGGGELVYATASNLYVTTSEWSPDGRAPATTRIHRFSITDPAGATYEGSGSVPGRLLNQFSMSESAGVLRVASTVDPAATATGTATTAESVVTTLKVDAGELPELGRVGGLGNGEQIYAVRFLGDVGYVVTFRRTDPLYVVDLTDPARPSVRGALKIPGYSAYLHPVGDGLLLGVGQDADVNGRVQGAQVSLFDVSDPAAPARLATAALGGGWSEVESDHHAFLWWPATGLAAIPVQPDGVVGFAVSRAGGVRPVGRVAAHGWARRAVVVGDRLLTVSDQGVTSSDLSTLAERAFVGWN